MESPRIGALSTLLSTQNPDGGWAYRGGGSWTEPTALAILALTGESSAAGHRERGIRFLMSLSRPDGGWPPRPSVDQSTWVTALALTATNAELSEATRSRTAQWLLRQNSEENQYLHRLRLRLLGLGVNPNQGEGWPWYPETAAWVSPTALTIIALERAAISAASPRIASARKFLWSRMCQDGGWNHGSTNALGYASGSYPETTGIALLAMRGETSSNLPLALNAAERHYHACRSSSGASWLRMALLAHGRQPAPAQDFNLPVRGTMDTALWLIADRASSGTNSLLEGP